MLSPELEKLIDLAVADGEVTEQERKVLTRKVAEAGADMDEFEMTLEAKLYTARQTRQANKPSSTTTKHGSTRKCPGCGAPIEAFQTKCSECGFEFSNIEAVQSANSLFDKLQNLEMQKARELADHEQRKSQNLMKLSEHHNSGTAMEKLFSSKDAQDRERNTLIANFEREASEIEKKYLTAKLNMIRTYAVPNTKEDLLELLSMASSNAYDNDGVIGPEEEAWLQKTDQIYQKILIASANDKPTLSQATSMIVSLIKRLPKRYKTFTRIPKELREQITIELRAEQKENNKVFWNDVKELFLGWRGWILAGAIILIIIAFAQNNGGMLILGLILLIGSIIILKKAISAVKKDSLYDR